MLESRDVRGIMIAMPEPTIPELPTHDEYFTAAQKIDAVLSETTIDVAYSRFLQNKHSFKNFLQETERLAAFVEPMDRSTGEFIDSDRRSKEAFYLGATAGALLIYEAHGSALSPLRLYSNVELGGIENNTDDEAHAHHQISEAILNMGHRGLVLMGPQTNDIIEHWSERFVKDVTKQRMFETGTGAVAKLAFNQHEILFAKQERAVMQALAQSAHDIDWDAQFAELLDH